MVGLYLLKHVFNLSDEVVCARWVENPYYQHFCGFDYFQHELPVDRSSMTRWRERIGPGGMEVLLKATIAAGLGCRVFAAEERQRGTLHPTRPTEARTPPSRAPRCPPGPADPGRLAPQHRPPARPSLA